MSALEIQWEYLSRAKDFTEKNGIDPITLRVIEMWERALTAIEDGNLDKIAREGMQSLTRRERKILESARDLMQKRQR